MITSVGIKKLRGILEGRLDDLTGLTVLVGPNGCGKSTILDSIVIGARGPEGIEAVVDRRRELTRAVRWLFHRKGIGGPSEIQIGADERTLAMRLQWSPDGAQAGATAGEVVVDSPGLGSGHIRFGPDRNFVNMFRPLSAPVVLIEAGPGGQHAPLHTAYTEARNEGRLKDVNALLKEIIPNFEQVEILTEGDKPIVHIVYDGARGSVPLAVAGDGVLAMVQLAIEIAAQPEGTVLLEEPEVHQHPAAIQRTAKTIVAAARRGIQLIISTHSLELIDGLIAYSDPDELNQLSVFRLRLDDGVLASTRIPGPRVAELRQDIDEDLR